ncbi:MAG: acetate uptake transporter [Halodesulfurarchaeum sp.]
MPAETETGNPAPLGLVGFGLTTVLLSLVNAGVFGVDLEMAVVPLAIAYGGTIQLFAGLLEYREGNTFGTVAFTSYGAFWWWFALLVLLEHGLFGVTEFSASASAIGMTLIMWGVFTLYMWVSTFRLNWALWLVFLTLWITFFLLGFGDLMGLAGLVSLGGWVGLLCGGLAMYTSFAEVTNWAFDGTVIPLGSTPFGGGGGPAESAEPAD